MASLGGYVVERNPRPETVRNLLDSNYTGFFYFEKRGQPYTLVFQGKVEYFCGSSGEARGALDKMIQWHKRVSRF